MLEPQEGAQNVEDHLDHYTTSHRAHLDKENEVFEAGVEMGLLPQSTNLLEVGVVHVGIDPKEPFVHSSNHLHEIRREGLSKLGRKH
jgi:hypothetical protein